MTGTSQRPIGQSMSRVDAHAKVTGAAKYASDYRTDDFSYSVLVNSTIASGRILSFNLSRAKSVEGVVDILTYENIGKYKMPKMAGPEGMVGDGALPLQDNRIYFNDQPIAIVVADSFENARFAARLIEVKYEASPVKAEIRRQKAIPKKKFGPYEKLTFTRGNSAKAYAKSEVKLDREYTTPIEHHNPMEPVTTFGIPDGEKLTLYDATQAVASNAKIMSEYLEMKPENVRTITKYLGGSFGGKGGFWAHQAILGMAVRKLNRPIKLTLSRPQMFTAIGHRAETIQKVKLAANKQGELISIAHETLSGCAVNKDFPEFCGEATAMLYKCPNLNVTHSVARRNFQSPTFMRAPGLSVGSFALESALDELAEELAMDPIDLRIKNYAEKDAEVNKPFSSKSLLECYKVGAEKFGWKNRTAKPRANLKGDWYVGTGMATSTYPSNIFDGSARVELLADGTAKVVSATQDGGTGAYTVMTQIAAEQLGLNTDQIKFDLGDSRYPTASPSGGSSTTASVGSAIKLACDEVKKTLRELAGKDPQSPLHGTEEIEFAGGRLVAKSDPKKSESYADILKRNSRSSIVGEGKVKGSRAGTDKYSSHAFGAQFAEVRVHRLTGEVRLNRLLGAFAAGKIVNPLTARSQFQGGMIWAAGLTLMEKTDYDLATARFVTKDLAEYHVPVQADIPDIEVLMVDEKEAEFGAIGVKGIGEIGIVGLGAAIANAVYNACGVRVRDLPITPDKVQLTTV